MSPLPAIERHRLGNGLRLVVHPDDRLPLVAVNLWYGVGSRDERPGRTGLAHLFEHMLFQGSAHVAANQHFHYVQQAGGVANGSTWFDRTNYYETLPRHHLELALWLESDRMGHLLPALTAEKLETQREVVLNERRQRIDNQPYGRAFERLHELLYPDGHPYGWPVIGYSDDIRAATLDDVEAFFRRYYVPDNAVLTLAGDVEPGEARDLVERWFGDLPGGGRARDPVAADGSPPPAAREVMPDRVELSRLYLAFRLPGYGSDDWYGADLLATVLAGGKSSPLYDDLVHERELAQSVSAWLLPTRLAATFGVVATARPGVDLAELEAALDEHLAAAGRRILEHDLERARNRLRTSWHDELQSLDRRADLLSQFTALFDRPERIVDEPERYLAWDAEPLAELARRWLDPAHRVTLAVVPAETA